MKYLGFVLICMLWISMVYAGNIQGLVKDAETNDPLIGANIVLEGTRMGTTTDGDGYFILKNVANGDYTLSVDYIGYRSFTRQVNVTGETVELQITLTPMVFHGSEITVLADRATRETPVAYSDLSKEEMELRLGSRDIPLVLNTTPSVYATPGGGGAGDARVNVRGFNQRNVAIMINGVPVNDMENGWVYWSNWDGVGDATASIQVQRGLSAVNLATPSIGGTMNIITDPTAQDFGLRYKQEAGSGGFIKSTIVAHSGLINNKFAFSGSIVRKLGDGIVDATWTDSWAYYFGASWIVNKSNRLELYALGAPQRHGQNLYMQNAAVYSHEFARELDGYDPKALEKYREAGREYSQNWAPVDPSYDGQQFFNGSTHERYDRGFINERENYYHKPIANLNWYSTLTEALSLYSTLYYSGGKGGGTGTLGSIKWNYDTPTRTPDWNATIAANRASETGSLGILRNSVNTQWTIGAISKAVYKMSQQVQLTGGLDWRTAEIQHYREVRDLLGGQYIMSSSSQFWSDAEKMRRLGDKIDYDFTNTVDWIGFFGQGEYQDGPLAGYVMGGYSQIKYTYVNHFRKGPDGNELTAETDWISGTQVKGGASYRVAENVDVYGNVGLVSKVPIFDQVMSDRDGTKAADPKNEKFASYEAGVNFTGLANNKFSAKVSAYYTSWKDRANSIGITNPDGTEGLIFLSGMDILHSGLEVEAAYQPHKLFRLDGAVSFGNWVYTDDVSGVYKDYETGGANDVAYNFYVKDLKVGDAPQTQFVLAGSVYPLRGLQAQLVVRNYQNFYAEWDPFSRTDPQDRTQSWKVPGYTVIDLHSFYTLPVTFKGIRVQIFAHVFNLLDAEYIQDAIDNSRFNAFDKDHDADDAEIFLGLPRYINAGLSLSM